MKKEKFELLKKWCITSDEESNKVLCDWYIQYNKIEKNNYLDKTVGNHFCMNNETLTGYMNFATDKKKDYTEITFDQFQEYVLKTKINTSSFKDYTYLEPLFKQLCIK
jgi:galactose-1-phosphate uridylyltransferase